MVWSLADSVSLPDNVSADTVIEDLQLDSPDVVELVMELEEEFDLNIDDEAVGKWVTFGDIANYIDDKLP